MARTVFFEWKGKEYDHNPKSADWYWALGILAVAGAVAAILFANYLFAILLVVAAAAIALHKTKQPPTHTFKMVEQGLLIDDDLHPFEKMMSFSVLEDIEGEFPPMLSIKTESVFSPHLVVPLEGVDADALYSYFLAHVDESAHHHSFTEVVERWLGY